VANTAGRCTHGLLAPSAHLMTDPSGGRCTSAVASCVSNEAAELPSGSAGLCMSPSSLSLHSRCSSSSSTYVSRHEQRGIIMHGENTSFFMYMRVLGHPRVQHCQSPAGTLALMPPVGGGDEESWTLQNESMLCRGHTLKNRAAHPTSQQMQSTAG
jgi:hypothetical protein